MLILFLSLLAASLFGVNAMTIGSKDTIASCSDAQADDLDDRFRNGMRALLAVVLCVAIQRGFVPILAEEHYHHMHRPGDYVENREAWSIVLLIGTLGTVAASIYLAKKSSFSSSRH